jgi:excisionase family DNA binding protein
MFTVRLAAEALGVSTKLIYSLCAAGMIRHERHGIGRGTIRIPQDALDEYRRSVTVGAEEGVASVPVPRPKLKLKNLSL